MKYDTNFEDIQGNEIMIYLLSSGKSIHYHFYIIEVMIAYYPYNYKFSYLYKWSYAKYEKIGLQHDYVSNKIWKYEMASLWPWHLVRIRSSAVRNHLAKIASNLAHSFGLNFVHWHTDLHLDRQWKCKFQQFRGSVTK